MSTFVTAEDVDGIDLCHRVDARNKALSQRARGDEKDLLQLDALQEGDTLVLLSEHVDIVDCSSEVCQCLLGVLIWRWHIGIYPNEDIIL